MGPVSPVQLEFVVTKFFTGETHPFWALQSCTQGPATSAGCLPDLLPGCLQVQKKKKEEEEEEEIGEEEERATGKC